MQLPKYIVKMALDYIQSGKSLDETTFEMSYLFKLDVRDSLTLRRKIKEILNDGNENQTSHRD